MGALLDFLLQLLSQFAGGPGLMENNLVRFSLPAIFWGGLLMFSLYRQREGSSPRERLLVWGFGLGAASAILMAVFVSFQMMGIFERDETYAIMVPLERALAMASIVVVASAFLRYVLDDARLAHTYLGAGLIATLACLLTALWQWPIQLAALTEAQFHKSWTAWLFQSFSSILLVIAIVLLRSRRNWLSNVVTVALTFFLLGELFFLANYATDKKHNRIICPVGNSFPILAIPLLGHVYIREQAIEKRRVQKDLDEYRLHLEDLVTERTAEIAAVNARLKDEVTERKRAEAELARRNAGLAAQNTIAATLSRSLDLETILNTALDSVLAVVKMNIGLVVLRDADLGEWTLTTCHRQVLPGEPEISESDLAGSRRAAISAQAMASMQIVVETDPGSSAATPDATGTSSPMRTVIGVPLISNNRAVGALILGSRQSAPVPPIELDLLAAVGQHIGMAIENARLYREAEQTAQELTLLQQSSSIMTSTLNATTIYDQIVEQSVKLLGCPIACILAWDESEQHARLVSSYGIDPAEQAVILESSTAPARLKTLVMRREPSVFDAGQENPDFPTAWREQLNICAMLCVPIWGMEGSPGSLFLMDRSPNRRWQYKEQMLVESFVNRAAVALMNANLARQLEWSAALEERQHIAADMHDGLAQTISLLGLQIGEVIGLVAAGSAEKALSELAIARETVQQVSVEVRRSIASLQGEPRPRRSLQEILSALPGQLPLEGGCPVELIFREEEPVLLPREQADQILPIVQETLVNAQRHARASQITLSMEREENIITITIADDGQGFEPGAWWEGEQHHFGLGIMHSRAARIGARLQIDSSPGRGTRVILTLPPPDRGRQAWISSLSKTIPNHSLSKERVSCEKNPCSSG